MERYQAILAAAKNLVAAQKATEKAGAARHALPPGSTRARVTTANARWASQAEERDRCEAALVTLVNGGPR
ncbi:MAG: hypothetical protein H6697_10040 [Myxococcales bacterium]|nr:hypothetical protein [Myxococcales bacterium]